MEQNDKPAVAQPTVAARPNASRKLLSRKAAARAPGLPEQAEPALEALFPAVEPTSAGSAVTAAPSAPTWSAEDETAFVAMRDRRKAAGHRGRRGPNVDDQVVRVGDIAPNAGTVVATIVGILAESGPLPRASLLDKMAGATFSHPKAKPTNRQWAAGYVAGAIRSGFVSVGETSPENGK